MSVDSATSPLFNQILESLMKLNKQSVKPLSFDLLIERSHDLLRYLSDPETLPLYDQIIMWHWVDYAFVHALKSSNDPAHRETWQTIAVLVRGINSKLPHTWQDDPSNTFEDVCSACILTLWNAIETFKYRSSFRTWCVRVVENAAKKQLRLLFADKRNPNNRAEPDPESLANIPASVQTQPASIVAIHELLAIINQVLSPPQHKLAREVFLLSAIGDMKGADIAKRLGVAQSTISQRLAAARAILLADPRIRAWLNAYFETDETSIE